jgi:hypothetical protein
MKERHAVGLSGSGNLAFSAAAGADIERHECGLRGRIRPPCTLSEGQ